MWSWVEPRSPASPPLRVTEAQRQDAAAEVTGGRSRGRFRPHGLSRDPVDVLEGGGWAGLLSPSWGAMVEEESAASSASSSSVVLREKGKL